MDQSEDSADRLDPVEVRKILSRAFEMADREPTLEVEIGRNTLAEIAAEVDLPLPAIASALAEHQLGLAPPDSLLERLVGPATVASRARSTASEDVMRGRVVSWLEVGHGLRPRVRHDGVVVAAKRRDVVGKLARSVRDLQGFGQLGKLKGLRAAAVDIGDKPGALCVVADVGDKRRDAMLGGAAVATGAIAIVGVGAAVAGPALLVAVPFAAGAGLLTSRLWHGSSVRAVQEDLDEALDGIVRGEAPQTALGRASERLSRRLRSSGS